MKAGQTSVSYHRSSPLFLDEMKFVIPDCLTPDHHLYFTFCHVSVKEGTENTIGYSWLPLLDANQQIISGMLFSLKFEKFNTTSNFTTSNLLKHKYPSISTYGPFSLGKTRIYSCRFLQKLRSVKTCLSRKILANLVRGNHFLAVNRYFKFNINSSIKLTLFFQVMFLYPYALNHHLQATVESVLMLISPV